MANKGTTTPTTSPSTSDSARQDDAMMPRKNPHFSRLNRAPYELGCFLQKLPENFSPYAPASAELVLIADAAAQHAENANTTIMSGIEAIGALMVTAAGDEEAEFGRGEIGSLGDLLRHLAVESQFLQHTMHDLRWTVREHRRQLAV